MIKTAQRRFILITLSILFVVFAVIYGVIWRINADNFTREVSFSLSDVEREYNEKGDIDSFRTVAVIKLSSYGNVDKIHGTDKFSDDVINSVIEAAKGAKDVHADNVGDVYYAVRFKGADKVVYIADMQMESERYHSVLVKTLLLLTAAFLALAVIVWALSGKVFEPIKRILLKQKQFISDASHELKTPVSIISANTDVIRTEENKAYADSIKKQVDRLNFLVSDLLTLARLDEGNVKVLKETFNLSEEVINTALPFDAVAFEKGKKLDLDVENGIIYDGAKDGVKQILNILLDNAVKYADNGGEIKVSLKKTGARIHLSVYNDGSLIPNEDSAKIFERFYRGDSSRSRESGGNGLGLSIAKSVATANKWTISANSVYGKSMTITLVL